MVLAEQQDGLRRLIAGLLLHALYNGLCHPKVELGVHLLGASSNMWRSSSSRRCMPLVSQLVGSTALRAGVVPAALSHRSLTAPTGGDGSLGPSIDGRYELIEGLPSG